MKKILVLGAGMVGRNMALDLASKHRVVATDFDPKVLESIPSKENLTTQTLDVQDQAALAAAVSEVDIVVGAVPGFLGFTTFQKVIDLGKDIVDISFFEEDPFAADELAKEKDVIAVMDCGVAPGIGNILLGFHDQKMAIESFECYVGGLPKRRSWPFEYKAPFSPIDVLEEYTRPARMVENSQIVTKPALSEPELMHFEEVGTLEAFNTDGLRSILKTMKHVPNMREKTLRYPGHIEIMRILRETGFFSSEALDVKGQKVVPLDLTSQLLFKEWKLGEEEAEFTIMRVKISGKEDGKAQSYEYNLFDEYDAITKMSSMARTTGLTATAVVNLILDGLYKRKGVSPPEYVGAEVGAWEYVQNYLSERKVLVRGS